MPTPSHDAIDPRCPRQAAPPGARGRALVVMLLIGLSGCAVVPSQEMSDARRALDAATQVDAARFAPHSLKRSSAALARAERELVDANYDVARAAALRARSEAIEARFLAREMAGTLAAIDAARAAGRPVAGAEALLQRARDAAADGKVERALDLLTRSQALSE